MKRPLHGLHLPCQYLRCRDGDTVEISLYGSDRIWAIRLIDCQAPDRGEPGRDEAKAHAEQLLENAELVTVSVPTPADPLHLLKNLTFDRIPARLWISDDETLGERMIKDGFAKHEEA